MADEWNFPKGDLMKGKKGLIMGVANDKSIAWGIASQLAAQGADIAFSYLGESLLRRVAPLAESIGVKHLIECDVTDDASMDAAFAKLKEIYGEIDFVIHSVAFANKNELQGSFVENTTREGFLLVLSVSFRTTTPWVWPRPPSKPRPAISPVILVRRRSASTPFRPVPCAPSASPGFPAVAACTPGLASSR